MGKVTVIRDYSRADLDLIVSMDDQCFGSEFRFESRSMQRFAESKNAISLVAEGEEGLRGFVIVHLQGAVGKRWGYVVTLDVDPKWRRMGLAARLLEGAEKRAVAMGAEWMDLHVYAGNEGAIRFYERSAYERVAIEPGFYGVGMDALVYRKDFQKLVSDKQ